MDKICNICGIKASNRNCVYNLEIYKIKNICSKCHIKIIRKELSNKEVEILLQLTDVFDNVNHYENH